MKIIAFCATIIFSVVSSTFAQDGWSAYQPRTLREITTSISEKSRKDPDVVDRDAKNNPHIILSYNSYQSRVNVVFTGKSRKVSKERKEVIEFWLGTFGKPKETVSLFEDEYLFTENKIEYWLPVQKSVASFFPKELKNGDRVALLVVWLGGRYEKDSFDDVFFVNEFEKQD